MSLKRMSEYKRDDYTYDSPDGDQWEITIVQTADRKYVEIKRNSEDGSDQVNWDVEMLLDIADAVRSAVQRPKSPRSHTLKSPKVIDHRIDKTPSDAIQESVEQSLEQMVQTDSVVPTESFSPERLQQDVEHRIAHSATAPPDEAKIKRANG